MATRPDVLLPTSPDEAVAAFGDGSGVTVLAGGTVVMPDLTAGRRRPERVLLLGRSGLAGVTRAGGIVTIGAATPVAALTELDEPLATVARHVGDGEIRAQATIGGNICAGPGETPRGDLQAPLIVLGARVRSTGAGGERVEPIEDFLASSEGRLVLDVSYDEAERKAGYAAVSRAHAHHYTILAVAAARTNGDVRLAATGAGPQAVRLRTAEQSGKAEDALKDADPQDDTLASAWYRREVLPGLVAKALGQLD
jgi:aerobic carbon-monoxide dehydrogenase medium subunit